MFTPLTPRQMAAYLKRIGLDAAPPTNLEGLRQLHHHQFFSIPFENFDIMLGGVVNLEPEHVFEKLVMNRRGGYCFELNGLLLRVLHALGFNVRPLLARVHLHDPPSGKTHQLSLVDFGDEQWLADAGFGGGGPRTIFPLQPGSIRADGCVYEVAEVQPWGFMLRTAEDGVMKDSYSFELHHVTDSDIQVGNHYTSTSSSSHFTQQCIASLPIEGGRISLRDDVFTEVSADGTRSRMIEPASYADHVDNAFGIELPRTPGIILR